MPSGEHQHGLGGGVVDQAVVLPGRRGGGRVQQGPGGAVPGPGLAAEPGAGGRATAEQQQLAAGRVVDHRRAGARRWGRGRVLLCPGAPGPGPGVAEDRAGAPAAEQDQFVLGRVVGERRPLPAPWRGCGGPGVARRTRGRLGRRRSGRRGYGKRGTRPGRGVPEQAAAHCEHRRDHLTSSARRSSFLDKRRNRVPQGLLRPCSVGATVG